MPNKLGLSLGGGLALYDLAGSKKPSASVSVNDFVSSASKRDLSITKLEKHLDDYRKGRGYLSNDTAVEVSLNAQDTASQLANYSPKSLKLYSAYTTAFDYEARSRYFNGLSETAQAAESITEAAKKQ